MFSRHNLFLHKNKKGLFSHAFPLLLRELLSAGGRPWKRSKFHGLFKSLRKTGELSVAPRRFSLPQTPVLFASPVAVAVKTGGGRHSNMGDKPLQVFSVFLQSKKPATPPAFCPALPLWLSFRASPFYKNLLCLAFSLASARERALFTA